MPTFDVPETPMIDVTREKLSKLVNKRLVHDQYANQSNWFKYKLPSSREAASKRASYPWARFALDKLSILCYAPLWTLLTPVDSLELGVDSFNLMAERLRAIVSTYQLCDLDSMDKLLKLPIVIGRTFVETPSILKIIIFTPFP